MMNYYDEIKEKLLENEIYGKVKIIQKKAITLLHILKLVNY